MSFNERIAQLNKMIADARHIVFFTGAGISTGSGLPDFRSANGLYSSPTIRGKSPEYMLSSDCLNRYEKDFFKYYRENMDFRGAIPSVAHYRIFELEQARDVSVITQNIDGLHEKIGSHKVYAVHGTSTRWYCEDCGHDLFIPEDVLDGNYDNLDEVPKCPLCGSGTIRPDIVLYGEGLSYPAWTNAQVAVGQADLMIVVGSSLTVQPAASLPYYFGNKDKLVIINRDPTVMDFDAGLIFHEDIQDVFNLIEIPEV